MNTRYAYTVHTFTAANMARYNQFSFTDIPTLDDARFYMANSEIVRHGGIYYEYRGSREYHSVAKTPSRLEVKNGRTVIHTTFL